MGPSGFTIQLAVLNISYLTTAILFVIGLKLLSKPETARAGNRWAAGGMILAIIALTSSNSGGYQYDLLPPQGPRTTQLATPLVIDYGNAMSSLQLCLPGIPQGRQEMKRKPGCCE